MELEFARVTMILRFYDFSHDASSIDFSPYSWVQCKDVLILNDECKLQWCVLTLSRR